uniref:Ig-like domain-containing protein n=1 Tax=Neovison vison TaxID=452646 RepID=A0A8C7EVJ8_NEOVI
MRRHWGVLLGLLCIQVCWVRGMTVEQNPSALRLQEGDSSTLKCNFSETARSVQWFRQHPRGDSLMGLFYIASGMKQSGRLNCTVNTKERSSTLHIGASQLEDSATYLCAVEAQCSLVICSLHPNCSWACSPPTFPGAGTCSNCSLCTFPDFQIYVTACFSF